MKSILLIIPYFGKWPVWFEAYMISIASNPSINWLCPTDCELPVNKPNNIKFLPTTLEDLNLHVNKVVSAEVPLNARKFCDLKPAYGDIFKNEIAGYDFWGICDMDIIWGDIRKYITPKLLNAYDIISSLEDMISGHFTLFRNEEKINLIYKELPEYKSLFEHPKFKWTDEVVLTDYLKESSDFKKNNLKVLWNRKLLEKGIKSENHQEYYLDRWRYQNGKVIDLYSSKKKEYMYLHFINWKRTMKYCEIVYDDSPDQFYVSYKGIHLKEHSNFENILNSIKNIFAGYYIILRIKMFRKKIEIYKNKIIHIFK